MFGNQGPVDPAEPIEDMTSTELNTLMCSCISPSSSLFKKRMLDGEYKNTSEPALVAAAFASGRSVNPNNNLVNYGAASSTSVKPKQKLTEAQKTGDTSGLKAQRKNGKSLAT